MEIIKHGKTSENLKSVLSDHRLSWAAKGVYAQLIQFPNHSQMDGIELSTHAKDGLKSFKASFKELCKFHYLVIYNKLLIIKELNKNNGSLTRSSASDNLMIKHDRHVTGTFLRNQWLIAWHRDDAQVTKALIKLAKYLNPVMVLYGIQLSKEKCHYYRESLPYLNRLIMSWKHHHLTSVGQTQRWMNQKKLNSKPWNSETQNRIFSGHQRTTLNNSPLRKGIPDAFKNYRK